VHSYYDDLNISDKYQKWTYIKRYITVARVSTKYHVSPRELNIQNLLRRELNIQNFIFITAIKKKREKCKVGEYDFVVLNWDCL